MYLYSAPSVQNRNTDDVSPKRCWCFYQTIEKSKKPYSHLRIRKREYGFKDAINSMLIWLFIP